jgi:hypothetical protein
MKVAGNVSDAWPMAGEPREWERLILGSRNGKEQSPMAPNPAAQKNHDQLFPNHVSTLAKTDPGLIEIFRQLRF